MPAAAEQHLERPDRPERHNRDESLVAANDPRVLILFDLDVIAQEAAAVRVGILLLASELACRLLRNRVRRPNLAMWMRIARAHNFAAIFEHLNMTELTGELCELFCPNAYDLFNLWQGHAREGQIMPRRKTHDPAGSRLAFRHEYPLPLYIKAFGVCVYLQGSKIVLKNECGPILRIANAAGPRISWAEIASRIVLRSLGHCQRFHGALPGPLSSMRGNKHPFACQRIEASVRLPFKVQASSFAAF